MSAMLEFDTGPLNWVRGDIEAALKSAADRVRAYRADPSLGNAMRLARDEAHQATGALRMVGLEGAAAVASALEETLSAMDGRTLEIEQATDTTLDALESLLKWVARMAEGRGEGELALFPTYRKLRELNGAERVFEGELFYPSLQVRPTQSAADDLPEAEMASLIKSARAGFQRGLLAFLRGVQVDAGLAAMRKALSQIESAAPSPAARTFWWACVGFIDALQSKGVEPDFHVKQLLARIDLQMRRLMDGAPQVAERLMRDALFFIAKSKSVGDEAQAVRSAFSLEKYLPKRPSMDADRLARFRPLLSGLKETLTESRHHWNAFAEGNAAALNDFQACAIRFGEQAPALEIAALNELSATLNGAAASIAGLSHEARDAVRLEIATTLLFLQNAISGEDIFDPDFPLRAESQIRRIKVALSGHAESSAEDLLDDGTRKAAEHALLAQLGREIISSLHEMEESLDAFFRDPQEREALSNLEALTTQIQGALSMLDQEDASLLLKYAIDLVNPYLAAGTPSDEEKAKVADALSSIGLFIEAHCAGRKDAARILMPVRIAYGLAEPEDADTGIFLTVEDGLAERKARIAASYQDWQDRGGDDTKKKFLAALTDLGHDADLIANSGLKSAVANAIRLVGVGGPDSSLAAAIAEIAGRDIVVVTHPTSANDVETLSPGEDAIAAPDNAPPAARPGVTDLSTPEAAENAESGITATACPADVPDNNVPFSSTAMPSELATEQDAFVVDNELLEIFLEEANEVLQTLSGAVAACQTHEDDRESLTVIRRAFHTLKGSGRMVGLMNFGEVAWGLEQLLNSWLADDKPATADLLGVVMQAHAHFSRWIAQLKDGGIAKIDSDSLLACASQVAQGAPVNSESRSATAAAMELAPTAQQPAEQGDDAGAVANAREVEAEPELEPEDVNVAGVRLSPGLYQIFKDESALWSQTLHEELEQLAIHDAPIVSEMARRGVHTLAGIAGTTGFNALSDLAHAIEIYLKELDDRPLPRNARITVMDALSRVIGMIDNIHAGATLLPADGLIRALAALQLEEYLPSIDVDTTPDFEDVEFKEAGDIAAESLALESAASESSGSTPSLPEVGIAPELDEALSEEVETGAEELLAMAFAADEPAAAQTALTGPFPEPTASEQTGAATHTAESPEPDSASESAPAIGQPIATAHDALAELLHAEDQATHALREANAPVYEQRQVRDEIDAELLPIFLEEADGLIPKAADSLRQWKARPSDLQTPSELRRLLHTIKGSARMAGAMRLGELTHIMETRVITVLEGGLIVDSGIFDTLENQFDRMANDVDRLKTGAPEPALTHAVADATETLVLLPMDTADTLADEAKAATRIPSPAPSMASPQAEGTVLRVRSDWIDRMVNEAGEVAIARSRIESEMFSLKRQVTDLSEALRRLKDHMREVEIQAEGQMQATFQNHGTGGDFDPLEFDRFTRFQEVTRFLAESVHDISTIQQNLRVQLGEADAALIQQARMNRELQQNLLRVRMVPLHSVSERLYRVVRQTARDLNKRAQLDVRNGELELDRGVLEKVVAPLEHLLRNAVAHGMELPEARAAAGKPEFGEISIDARQEGNEMVLVVKDDGAGLNLDRIREKALALNLLSPGVDPSDSQLAQMIFVPGFSTADQVTEVAGRGVGMDVVKNEINSLGGRIAIATEAGKGVTFSIYLPLTLAVTQAVIVTANKQEYAVPTTMVEQVQELKPDHLAAAMAARAIEWRGKRYPLFYLPHLLGQMDAIHEVQRFNTVVLMKSGTLHAAVLVDVVEGAREIVVKNIGPQVARITGIAGATVRGDGKVMLILNPVPLAVRALNAQVDIPAMSPPVRSEAAQETAQAPMVLVVDDSVTVRKITSRLMVREGYRVDTAKDGVDALEKMQDLIPDVVLLDVEMPRMDGFGLARVMRDDAKLKNVPIIMITSRTADKHRNHALEIGVNVYLGKPFQEAVLLGHIGELLGARTPTSV